MTTSDPLWFLGAVCALAVGAGLSLYATLVALGLLSMFGLTTLPPRLVGLEAPVVWGPLLVFYLIEAALARADGIDMLADSAHAGIRPLGAALLAAAASAEFGADTQWVLAMLGGALALWTHHARSGLNLILRTSRRPHRASILASAAEATAVVLVIVTTGWPGRGVALAALLLMATLPSTPRLWNAAAARRRAAWAIFSYPFRGRAWHGMEVLPERFAAALFAATAPGVRVHRIAPAVARHLPGVPPFSSGWLAFTSRGPFFVFRGFRGPRATAVAAEGAATTRAGRFFDALRVEGPQPAEFLLPKSAPRPETLLSQFVTQSPSV